MPAPDFINDRLGTLRKRLAPQDAHGLLVTHPVNIRYLTGFVGHDSWAYIPLAGKKIYILSDFRYEEQIEREAPYAIALMRKKSLAETLAKLLERFKDVRALQ